MHVEKYIIIVHQHVRTKITASGLNYYKRKKNPPLPSEISASVSAVNKLPL